MPQHLESFGAVGPDRLERGIFLDRPAQVDQSAVETRGDNLASVGAVEHFPDDGAARHAPTLAVERYGDLRAHSGMNVGRAKVARTRAGIGRTAATNRRRAIMNGRTNSSDGRAGGAEGRENS